MDNHDRKEQKGGKLTYKNYILSAMKDSNLRKIKAT